MEVIIFLLLEKTIQCRVFSNIILPVLMDNLDPLWDHNWRLIISYLGQTYIQILYVLFVSNSICAPRLHIRKHNPFQVLWGDLHVTRFTSIWLESVSLPAFHIILFTLSWPGHFAHSQQIWWESLLAAVVPLVLSGSMEIAVNEIRSHLLEITFISLLHHSASMLAANFQFTLGRWTW